MEVDDKQLFKFARHYLRLAMRLKSKCSDMLDVTIGDLRERFEESQGDNIYLLLAHLASSAYRISTLVERNKSILDDYDYRPYAWSIKKKKSGSEIQKHLKDNLQYFLPMLLRDQIGHNSTGEHDIASIRNPIIKSLTPRECLDYMKLILPEIESKLCL